MSNDFLSISSICESHTVDDLYRHRAVLFAIVVHVYKDWAWKSKRHADGSMYDGMFIVGINSPFGQITYHYYISPCWDMFDCDELDHAPEWDGHSSDDVLDRLKNLIPFTAPNNYRRVAHWVEVPVVWRSRRKYECSFCSSYVTGRFLNSAVHDVHKVCHTCGALMSDKTEELLRDSNGFLIDH